MKEDAAQCARLQQHAARVLNCNGNDIIPTNAIACCLAWVIVHLCKHPQACSTCKDITPNYQYDCTANMNSTNKFKVFTTDYLKVLCEWIVV